MSVPIVVYDACVLYPAPLRDFLLRLGQADLVRFHWTHDILDECFRNLLLKRKDLSQTSLQRTRHTMEVFFPSAMVSEYQGKIRDLELPDPNDRHVLAAAIQIQATQIVTFNLRDFPASVLTPLGITAVHPDAFVVDKLDVSPVRILEVVAQQAAALRNPPSSISDILTRLRDNGLHRTAAMLTTLRGDD